MAIKIDCTHIRERIIGCLIVNSDEKRLFYVSKTKKCVYKQTTYRHTDLELLGGLEPNIDSLRKLSKIFNISIDELISGNL